MYNNRERFFLIVSSYQERRPVISGTYGNYDNQAVRMIRLVDCQ